MEPDLESGAVSLQEHFDAVEILHGIDQAWLSLLTIKKARLFLFFLLFRRLRLLVLGAANQLMHHAGTDSLGRGGIGK